MNIDIAKILNNPEVQAQLSVVLVNAVKSQSELNSVANVANSEIVASGTTPVSGIPAKTSGKRGRNLPTANVNGQVTTTNRSAAPKNGKPRNGARTAASPVAAAVSAAPAAAPKAKAIAKKAPSVLSETKKRALESAARKLAATGVADPARGRATISPNVPAASAELANRQSCTNMHENHVSTSAHAANPAPVSVSAAPQPPTPSPTANPAPVSVSAAAPAHANPIAASAPASTPSAPAIAASTDAPAPRMMETVLCWESHVSMNCASHFVHGYDKVLPEAAGPNDSPTESNKLPTFKSAVEEHAFIRMAHNLASRLTTDLKVLLAAINDKGFDSEYQAYAVADLSQVACEQERVARLAYREQQQLRHRSFTVTHDEGGAHVTCLSDAPVHAPPADAKASEIAKYREAYKEAVTLDWVLTEGGQISGTLRWLEEMKGSWMRSFRLATAFGLPAMRVYPDTPTGPFEKAGFHPLINPGLTPYRKLVSLGQIVHMALKTPRPQKQFSMGACGTDEALPILAIIAAFALRAALNIAGTARTLPAPVASSTPAVYHFMGWAERNPYGDAWVYEALQVDCSTLPLALILPEDAPHMDFYKAEYELAALDESFDKTRPHRGILTTTLAAAYDASKAVEEGDDIMVGASATAVVRETSPSADRVGTNKRGARSPLGTANVQLVSDDEEDEEEPLRVRRREAKNH